MRVPIQEVGVPTYQYACKACGHRFEAVQSFSDGSITVCPVCGEEQVRKVFSAVGVVFKGSGFYRNDSREPAKSGSSPSSSAKDSKDSKDSGSNGSSEKKTESAPASSSSSSSDSKSSGSTSSASSGSSSGSTSTAAAS